MTKKEANVLIKNMMELNEFTEIKAIRQAEKFMNAIITGIAADFEAGTCTEEAFDYYIKRYRKTMKYLLKRHSKAIDKKRIRQIKEMKEKAA